jgi:hypothetical protein
MVLRIDGHHSMRHPSSRAEPPRSVSASPPAPPPAPPRASVASVKEKSKRAEVLQARADRAARNLGNTDDPRRHIFVADARREAAQAWSDVDQEVRELYATPPRPQGPPAPPNRAGASVPTPTSVLDQLSISTRPGASADAITAPQATQQLDHIEATTEQLLDAGIADPKFQRIVMTAQADTAVQVKQQLSQAPTNGLFPTLDWSASTGLTAAWDRANTLEIVGRAAASDTPLETLETFAPTGANAWTAEQRQALQAQVLSGGDADIAAAYQEGGIPAATGALSAKVQAAGSPEEAAAITARSRALVLAAGDQLGQTNVKADADNDAMSNSRENFETTVANLAAVYEATASTDSQASVGAHDMVLQAVTSHIGGNVGAFDEALAKAAMRDGNASLATDTVTALRRADKTGQADAIINRGIEEFNSLTDAAESAQDDYNQRQLAAQTYAAKAAPFADAAGVEAALDAYWARDDNAQSRGNAEAANLRAMEGAAALLTLSGGSSKHVQRAQDRVDDFIAAPSTQQAVASHDKLQAFVAAQQFSSSAGRPGLLSPAQLERAIARADDPQAALDGWFSLMQTSAVGQSTSAKAQGDFAGAQAAIDSLGRYGKVFAAGDDSYDVAIEGLRQAAAARNEEAAIGALDFWASQVNTASNIPGAFPGRFSSSGALLLSTVGAGADLVDLVNDPSWGNAAAFGLDTAQAFSNYAVATEYFQGASTTSASLQTAGKWINGAGAVLSTADLLFNPSDNNVVNGLKLISTIGSWAVLAGGPAGAAGAAVSLLATAAVFQYSRVAASNKYETGDAEAFLRQAAKLDGDVAYNLRNDDSNGRNHNEVIYRAVAQHLGIEADFSDASKKAVVQFLNGLNDGQASRLADTAARIGFETVTPGTGADAADNNGQVYRETAENDDSIRDYQYVRPESVNGLAIWIETSL